VNPGNGRRLWLVALVAALTAGLVWAGQGWAAPARRAPAFTATQLSDGLLFNDGPVAAYLAKLDRPQPERTEDAVRAAAAINKAIEADPKWAATFAARVQSGDPRQIEPALNELARLSRTVLEELFGRDTVDQAVRDLGQVIERDGDEEFKDFFFHTQVALYEHHVLLLYFYWWVETPTIAYEPGNRGELMQELAIRTIAENLWLKGDR
jgi:SdpC family antimicrobial peptide